jgi:Leucine-rich repeat (LRR) protein
MIFMDSVKCVLLVVNVYCYISCTNSLAFQFIGNLKKLMHFDASTNNIKWIAPEIGSCCSLTDLTLSCNEIQVSVLVMCSSGILLNPEDEVYQHFRGSKRL